MKIVAPSVKLLPVPQTPIDLMKHIERCGRVCYKSEEKITDTSYESFLRSIIKRGHEAVLEHGTIILTCLPLYAQDFFRDTIIKFNADNDNLCYLRHTGSIVSGNVRAWRDFIRYVRDHDGIPGFMYRTLFPYKILFDDIMNGSYDSRNPFDMQFNSRHEERINAVHHLDARRDPWCLQKIHNRHTILFVCDRGVSHEIVRHRPASYCQESTRYCNYSKDAFENQITVIKPCFLDLDSPEYSAWLDSCCVAEIQYFAMLESGCTPQQARAVLPNSLKTEVIMTASLGEWVRFFNLRDSDAAHPQMREVATQAKELLNKEYRYEVPCVL